MNNENQPIKTSPRDFLMHILMMVLLYVGTFNFLNLVFAYVDKAFPDPLNQYYSDPSSAVRWPIAILVVIFPVFLWTSRFLARDIAKNPAKAELGVRKGLTYLTLFLAAVLIIGDLVTLIYNLLEGDLTTPFILKVITVLILGGVIFRYYLYDLRRGPDMLSKNAKVSVWVIIAVVSVTVIAGFFVAGSPFRQRQIRFDEQRLNNLQEIQYRIVNFWQAKDKLPETLDALRDPIAGFIPPVDPETKNAYGYKTTGPLAFELCAMFNFSSKAAGAYRGGPMMPLSAPIPEGVEYQPETWDHPAGEYCFPRTIDPDLYRLPDRQQKF